MPIFKAQSSKRKVQNFLLILFPSRGFTLVELLVVLAVMGILAAIGLARYSDFGDRQRVRSAALELKTNLRKYQTYAIAGQKNPNLASSPCSGPMEFYSVNIVDNDTYEAVLKCGSSNISFSRVDLPSGIEISASCSPEVVRFYPLNQGVDLPSCSSGENEVRIFITYGTYTYTVHVNKSGEIY